MKIRHEFLLALDRTFVLFLGLGAGAIVGASLIGGAAAPEAQASAPPAPPRATAAPALQQTPRLARAAAEGRTVHIGVFGDSFGDGVHAGLYEQLPSARGIVVHKMSRQATGFTRYRTTDLLADTRRRLAEQPVDIAVLSFGANDIQGIYFEGHGSTFMSERWRRIVEARVTAVVALLRQHGAAVYWVGLPTMRDPAFDAQIRQIDAFYAELMPRLGVPYVETARMTADAAGRYAPYLAHPRTGRRFMARANDGVHMTIPGYMLLTRGLAADIERSIAEARARSGGGRAPRQAR
ncbi:MAG: uncharacterized protein QOI38_2360 [Sphingomonadales bacterium]|jgi:hypothetical protein|nr:uncharacterized protein [Sphingomonadales bacterium]